MTAAAPASFAAPVEQILDRLATFSYAFDRQAVPLDDMFSRLHHAGHVEKITSRRSPVAQVTQWAAQQLAGSQFIVTCVDGEMNRNDPLRWQKGLPLILTVARDDQRASSRGETIHAVHADELDRYGDLRLPFRVGSNARGTREHWGWYLTDLAVVLARLTS